MPKLWSRQQFRMRGSGAMENVVSGTALTDAGQSRRARFLGDGFSQRRAVENLARRLGDPGEHTTDLAILLGAAVGASTICDPAEARQLRDRSVDQAQNASERDLVGRHQKTVAAKAASATCDDAVMLEVEENLLEKFARDALTLGDFPDHQRVFRPRERDERLQRVTGLLRDHILLKATI